MIKVMCTVHANAYIIYSPTNEVIIAEYCHINKIIEVLNLMPRTETIFLEVTSQVDIKSLLAKLKRIDLIVESTTISETLDLNKELRCVAFNVKEESNRTKIDFKTLFLLGCIIALLVSIPFALNFFNAKNEIIINNKQIITLMQGVKDTKIDMEKLYQELDFNYSPKEVLLLEVDNNNIKYIFNSDVSGLKVKELTLTEDSVLEINPATTGDEDNVNYSYTLTAKLK